MRSWKVPTLPWCEETAPLHYCRWGRTDADSSKAAWQYQIAAPLDPTIPLLGFQDVKKNEVDRSETAGAASSLGHTAHTEGRVVTASDICQGLPVLGTMLHVTVACWPMTNSLGSGNRMVRTGQEGQGHGAGGGWGQPQGWPGRSDNRTLVAALICGESGWSAAVTAVPC